MSNIKILPVNTRQETRQFIELPWSIYHDDPNWVPHLIRERKLMFDSTKNPFFQHGDMKLFLAKRGDQFVGRVAAIKNGQYTKTYNDGSGFFGFFESVNDQEVANCLLDTARGHLQGEGFTTMVGPANPSSNQEFGLLVDGFTKSPTLLMAYNPSYYQTLLENYGLLKAKDLYAYVISVDRVYNDAKLRRRVDIVQRRMDVSVRSLDKRKFQQELQHFMEIYDSAWAPNWGFVPLTKDEIGALATELRPLIDPDLVLFIEIGDKTIGAALGMPDLNPALRKMNGRLLPFGLIKFLFYKNRLDLVRILTLGVVPKYQGRGLDALLYHEISKKLHAKGIPSAEASWILEENKMMIRGVEMLDGVLDKTYRVYDLKI